MKKNDCNRTLFLCVVMSCFALLCGCSGRIEEKNVDFVERTLPVEVTDKEQIAAMNAKLKEKVESGEYKREKIVIWSYFETQAQRQGMDELVRDFNQSQNFYEAEWEYVPMIGFNKSLSSAYTENNLPDMAILDNPDMPEMIQLGLFEDITDYAKEWALEETFYPSILDTVRYENRYYGVPFNCNNTALIYNTAIFEEEEVMPPETWEELREAALSLTTEDRAGFLLCGIEGEQGAFQLLSWLLAAGENPSEVGGEKTVEAFSFLKTMLDDGSLAQNCINLTQTDVAREFVDGRTAMMQNGPWVYPMLDESGIEYGVIPIPGKVQGTAVVGGENIGILKGKSLDGSIKFIQFCMEKENITDFCSEANVLPGNMEYAKAVAEEKTNLKAVVEQMENAVTRTTIPYWGNVSECLTDGFFSLVAGEKTPEEIAEDIKTAVES